MPGFRQALSYSLEKVTEEINSNFTLKSLAQNKKLFFLNQLILVLTRSYHLLYLLKYILVLFAFFSVTKIMLPKYALFLGTQDH